MRKREWRFFLGSGGIYRGWKKNGGRGDKIIIGRQGENNNTDVLLCHIDISSMGEGVL